MVGCLLASLLFSSAYRVTVECNDLLFDSKVLIGNPLKDPTRRHIAVFRPSGTRGKQLPLIVYLPGFGGSSEDALTNKGMWQGVVSGLHDAGCDVVFAVVDGRNRYVCSQYVNSGGSGRYLDYICDELAPYLEKAETCGRGFRDRLVVGHSSGGFGALRLGMARQRLFGGVVALSPDSYFDVTHKPFTVDAAVVNVGLAKIQAVSAPGFAPIEPLGGDVGYALALCADYAGNKDGTFNWLYDAQGHYRPEVYEQWRNNDPAVLAERSAHPFAKDQRVYLEGAAQDDFKANIGAQKVADGLKGKGVTFTTYFPPGHHSDHLAERIVRGISWVLGAPIKEVAGE
ncbi:MAG: alpha/beta hydrolase [Fimbriimonas sp.]|nr:alpha/beta hydrolase [Fimbriimonas sp.]